MALFVYVTDNCVSDARTHGLTPDIERFRDRVESTQSTSLFDPFPPPYLVKKKLGGRQGRLIADLRAIGDHAVVVFLTILIRGSRAYEDEFSRDPRGYGDQHFSDLVSNETLALFIEERTRKSLPPVKPNPTAAEYELLYEAYAHHNAPLAEDLVCETREWVEQVTEERISKQLVLLCPACLKALTCNPGLHFIPIDGKPGWGIWTLRSEDRLLLITPATDLTASAAETVARTIAAQLDGKDATMVLRASRRAYPALILADDDLWIDLEKEPVANMALSPEESEVLESARGSEHPFPLFINGRAGSGKSTILQYLFADLLFHYLTKQKTRNMAPPIYLTANGELLRMARSFVERLLLSEATLSSQSGVDLVRENREVLDEAFREFQPHLLAMVHPDEYAQRFARASRIDYARFRRMWTDRFGKEMRALREFGPDLSWHVIRSYIKGTSSETFLEPDEYMQLPENQISVSHKAFKLVYDRVWTGWYQRILNDEGLWDDQDLTRYVLDNELAKPIHPAVFCDEAQDFTRLELELLLRLNLFSNRTLPPNDISRVSFAFAGDQFQTLNPTGFRWDAIKASFVEKFIFELDPARRSGRADLNYRELKYNYRSTHKIVRFGNHVQAMRAALLQPPNLRPQIPWASSPQSFPVVWFRANDAAFWKKYRENPTFVMIVPCSEGEEADYVQNDPLLRQNIRTEDGVPLNVLSAGRAKGCEYPAVIVYGFGAAAEKNVVSEFEAHLNAEKTDPDESLPMQYFINRLYVAVSRPKRRLVIVDTEEGFARLWKCAQDEAAEDLMLRKIKNGRQIWGPEIEGMTVGKPDELTRESAGDPLENAKAFEADGLARQDAFLLKQAALAYRSGGDIAKARECRARALEADSLLLEAGDAYFEVGFSVPDGLRCLWRAGKQGWIHLCDNVAQYPQLLNEIEFLWAREIVRVSTPSQAADILGRFAKRLDDVAFADGCVADAIWRDAIDSLFKPLLDKTHRKVSDDIWGQLVASLDRIRAKGVRIPTGTCARIYFLARRYGDAVRLWEESGDTRTPDYHKAAASVEPYPQRILSLSRLGSTEEIVQAYSAAREVVLSSEQATIVVEALRRSDRQSDAMTLAWQSGVAGPMLSIAVDAWQKAELTTASSALYAGIILLVRQGQWEPLAAFASSLEFTPAADWTKKEIVAWAEQEAEAMQLTLVRALARSDELIVAPSRLQRQLSDFLRRYLRVKDGKWKRHLSVQEAGAAIERGGRFTDAIGFYEAVTMGQFSEDQKQFARRRWLVSKQRQIEHEKSQGGVSKARAIEREMQQAMKSLGIKSLTENGAYPKLPPLEQPALAQGEQGAIRDDRTAEPLPKIAETAAVDHVSIAIGPYKMNVSRRNSRCNITQSETMETAFVKISDRKCGGEVEFNEVDEWRWFCPSWKLTVQFPKQSGEPLSIELDELGTMLRVQL